MSKNNSSHSNALTELPTPYQQFIYKSRYARWLEEENRRENWDETVSRYFNFFEKHLLQNQGYRVPADLRNELERAVRNLEVMPSMRALMTAGPALERSHVAAYNCCFVAIDHIRAFDEIMYILMCGCGVGFSVEREFVSKLPTVCEDMHKTDTKIIVHDSKEGWARSFRELISLLYSGQIPDWDLSQIRPKGARLKTFGGRASGPEPLDRLFRFCVNIFRNAAGRKLRPIECHDICCMIGDIVVVGGVRRSALISLSDLNDPEMREAKSGNWSQNELTKVRRLANNSAVYHETPSMETFMEEWLSLVKSKSGERGIFNRAAAQAISKRFNRRKESLVIGTNPCSEILLRIMQFCNLSEVIVRPNDTIDDLKRKVRFATILGTWQASLTKFPLIRSKWSKNCIEEALLGVSMTGILDNPFMRTVSPELERALCELREEAVRVNKETAEAIGINPSAAITCIKPSGTVSEMTNTAPGIHPRHSEYYIRRVRADNKDPMTQFMKDSGFVYEPCVMSPNTTTVFEFPVKCKGAFSRNSLTAEQHLNLWLTYQRYWCEHKPSITVNVRDHEWLSVGDWVYRHFDEATGISFLPHFEGDHIYKQTPYSEIDEETYNRLNDAYKHATANLDWSRLSEYEKEDTTAGSQTLSCSGNSCAIVDLTDSEENT